MRIGKWEFASPGLGPQERPKVIFASICALLAAGAAAYVYLESDSLFRWNWAEAQGSFVVERDESLLTAARDLAEAGHPGKACVEQWLGRDEKYVYLGLGCAIFRRHLGELVTEGDEIFLPTRLRYSGTQVSGLEQAAPGPAFANRLRRIFPQKAAEIWKSRLSFRDYKERGLARMEAKGLAAGR